MAEAQEKEAIREAEEKRLEKVQALKRRNDNMRMKMQAARTYKRILIWLEYKYLDILAFNGILIGVCAILGCTARVVWEIWKVIFNLSL